MSGDLIKAVRRPGFEPDRSAFFMPTGKGPCRFGQYNMLHRMVLDELGYPDVPIYAPNQDEGLYEDLGMVGSEFVRSAWQGVVATDLLTKCLHETRPYEKDQGRTQEVYGEFIRRVSKAIEDGSPMEPVLKEMREAFAGIPRTDEARPLIGMVGEIYVRSHTFSNEDLIRKIEVLGGEVWLSPFGEWIFYQNHTNIDNAKKKGKLTEYLSCKTTHFVQKKMEKDYTRIFDGFLKTAQGGEHRRLIAV
jgi:predicted nucleotide-binding protein (sugar kinase/HSP70/actin superfamily)